MTDQLPDNPERFIAFQGVAELYAWRQSSSTGCKVVWRLANRDELAHFDKVTKRNRRAGHRYSMAVSDAETGEVLHQCAIFFLGGKWEHTVGATVAFQLEGYDALKGYTTLPTADLYGTGFMALLTLVQIGDDEVPIDQAAKDALDRLKGGPRSKHAAQLCKDPDFQVWVAGFVKGGKDDESKAAHFTRDRCGITTRAELDHDPVAWAKFQRLVEGPFIRWMTGGQPQ